MKIDLRKPTESDLARFKECLATDPDHAGQDADKWTTAPGEFWTFFDEHNNCVWVRIERVLRVSIQHDPASPRKALVSLLYKGFSWLQTMARKNGHTEIIFESRAPRLIQFLHKLFGFEPLRDNHSVRTI